MHSAPFLRYEGGFVDFIEKLLHLYPDGGNGLTELGLLFGIAVWALVLCRRTLLNRSKGDSEHA